ncbi:hypothetical protein Vi05172_g6285 [Venturia inaequalis]|nr:hypothetical protein Vi05172_g6285 [Venturia inaequalis]
MAVKALIEFLYTGDYEELPRSATDDPLYPKEKNIPLHVKTYVLAQKLLLGSLEKLALSKLIKQLRAESVRNHSGFADVVQEVYENTAKNDAARQIVLETSIKNMGQLLDEDDGPFSNMMEAMGEFGKDMSRAVRFSKEIQGKHALRPVDYHIDFGYGSVGWKDYWCSHCDRHWKLNRRFTVPFGEWVEMVACPHPQGCGSGQGFGSGKKLIPTEDKSFVMLYMAHCTNCQAECMSSNAADMHLWRCYNSKIRCSGIGFKVGRRFE